jgi:hypothetical protein
MTREELFNKINTRPQAAVAALLALYERQTSDEQSSETTSHENGVGFNGTDAHILTSFAKQALRNQEARRNVGGYPNDLSEKQLALLRKKLAKYGRQLLEEAEARGWGGNARPQSTGAVVDTQVANSTEPTYDADVLALSQTIQEQLGECSCALEVGAKREENCLPEVNGFDVPPSCRLIREGSVLRFPNAREVAMMSDGRHGQGTDLLRRVREVRDAACAPTDFELTAGLVND